MKELELYLNKKILIVCYDSPEAMEMDLYQYEQPERAINTNNEEVQIKHICKGSYITEDMAMNIVDKTKDGYYKDYSNINSFFTLPTKSFISAIENAGYHWGDNPEGKHRPKFNDYSSLISYNGDCEAWDIAEDKTFNPSKSLLFEILR